MLARLNQAVGDEVKPQFPIAFPMPISEDTAPMNTPGCSVAGCPRAVAVLKHRLCRPHYKRWIRTGSVGSPKIRKKKEHKPYRRRVPA